MADLDNKLVTFESLREAVTRMKLYANQFEPRKEVISKAKLTYATNYIRAYCDYSATIPATVRVTDDDGNVLLVTGSAEGSWRAVRLIKGETDRFKKVYYSNGYVYIQVDNDSMYTVFGGVLLKVFGSAEGTEIPIENAADTDIEIPTSYPADAISYVNDAVGSTNVEEALNTVITDLHAHDNKEVLDLLSESDTGKLQFNGVTIGGAVDLSGYAKTYTSLAELGLTAPISVGEIFNAMPNKTTAVLSCEAKDESVGTVTVSDIPESYGILTIKKNGVGRLSIEYQNSSYNTACNVKKWIGTLKGADGTGLYWKQLSAEPTFTTLSDIGLTADATFQDVVDALPKGGSALLGVKNFTNYQTIFPYEEGNDQFARVHIVKGIEDGSNVYARWFRKDGVKEAIANFNISDNEFSGWQKIQTEIVDNLTSIDTDKPLSANQGKILKDELGLKANDSEVVKKTDIATTLDSTVTNEQVAGAKVSYDRIKGLEDKVKDGKFYINYTNFDKLLNHYSLTKKDYTIEELFLALPDGIRLGLVYNNDTTINKITDLPNGSYFFITIEKVLMNYNIVHAYNINNGNYYMWRYHANSRVARRWEIMNKTSIEDVPKTSVTIQNVTGSISYSVINGICYVALSIVVPTNFTNGGIIAPVKSLPNFNSNCSNGHYQVSKGGIIAIQNDGSIKLWDGIGNNVYGSFSYPVAES